ncbi:MAG: ATP-binding protein [Lachnospiraceae bacterium]|nr:ATP-binding protein [Lachnospiraceae bacterium]
MTRDESLLLFCRSPYTALLRDFCLMIEGDRDTAEEIAPHCLQALLSMAGETGFGGNLWHDFLTRLLVSSENSYTLSAELRGAPDGTVREFALHDMTVVRGWFALDLHGLAEKCGLPMIEQIADYHTDQGEGKVYSARIRERIETLAGQLAECGSDSEMLDALTSFYAHYGVGALGLHKAFRLRMADEHPVIRPITRIADVRLDDLVGYESAKEQLIRNTEAFLAGAPANNCLLYGDAGTGKSTSVKALANTYYDRGLRIIEIYRHEFRYLHQIIGEIKHRNYRFLLYMDDLSFEEFETEYKYLKAVIEGGLEKKPDNVLIYATSNRRHLVRESFRDKQKLSDDDVHRSDTVQEKLSLFDRFGLTIYFGAPTPQEYYEIVRTLAARAGISMPEDELLACANRWELKHAGYSGRTAQQMIDDLLGKEALLREA